MQPMAEVVNTEVSVEAPPPAGEDFETFYRSSFAGTVRMLLSLTGRPAIAEELAQEALISAYRRWDEVRALDRPDLWVRRVAVNRAISRHRRLVTKFAALARLRSEQPMLSPPPTDDGPVWAAVQSLPRTQAAAVVLWSIEGYTLAEIGEVLGCSEETARTHLRRARQRLADILEVDNDER